MRRIACAKPLEPVGDLFARLPQALCSRTLQQVGPSRHLRQPLDVTRRHWTPAAESERCHMRAQSNNESSERLAAGNAAQRTLQATQLLQEALLLLCTDSTLPMAHVMKRAPDRLLRLPEVERLTGLRRSAIYVQMQRGVFPRSVKAGRRTATWSESAVQAWIADRLDGRTT